MLETLGLPAAFTRSTECVVDEEVDSSEQAPVLVCQD